ncbi:MAG: glycerate dehydrogenase [Acidobacteriota bacterium]|jgi:glycerate dehydrogenase|nr:glycerate dehydrogenase [Acidobacteriota bacterium]
MHRIVFLERNSVDAEVRRPAFAHEWREYAESTQEQAVERLQSATIAIMNKIGLWEAQLAQLPDLKLIAIAATGTDRIDLESCVRRGISVTNVRGYAAISVSEHVLMLILALRRNLVAYREDVRRALWQQSKQFCLRTREIQDTRACVLGVLGYGALGRATAELARATGMRVMVGEHKGAKEVREGRTAFDEVLRESDVVTLHAPLTDETRHMIGAHELELMKPTAILINTARGLLVDEAALAEALRTGKIAGAGVDVLSNEPPREGNPLLDLDLPNLIVTPHVAWASRGAMQSLADQLIDNIEAFVRGEPQNIVTGKP